MKHTSENEFLNNKRPINFKKMFKHSLQGTFRYANGCLCA